MNFLNKIRNLFIKKKGTGLIPQPIDERDYPYLEKKVSGSESSNGKDLRSKFPVVTDQEYNQSCTYHAAMGLLDYFLKYKKQFISWEMDTSEAYGWYFGRLRLGVENKNEGTILRDAFKVIQEFGFVPQSMWDYKNGIYKIPDNKTIMAGRNFKLYLKQLKGYYALRPYQILNALDNELPVAFGMPTDSDYQKLRRGNPYVKKIDGSEGFHAQLIVGYVQVDNDIYYIVRNSWGNIWGVSGYAYIKKELVDDIGFDFWTLQ